MSVDQKLNFLYGSISDIQSTIRAVDVKAGFLFVVIFIPVGSLSDIVVVFKSMSMLSQSFLALSLLVAALWVLSVYVLFKTVVAISNPADHVKGTVPHGSFYGADQYSLKSIDYLFNFPIKSNFSLSEEVAKLPGTENKLVEELVFEKMKIIYIRDIKIKRLSLCFRLVLSWLLLGGFSWLVCLLRFDVNA